MQNQALLCALEGVMNSRYAGYNGVKTFLVLVLSYLNYLDHQTNFNVTKR